MNRCGLGVCPALIIGACGLLTGCCADTSTLTERPFFEVLLSRPADEAIGADEIYPRSSDARLYLVHESEGPSRELPRHEAPTDRFNATFKTVDGDEQELFFRVSPEGDRLLSAVIDYPESAISLFSPPLVDAYARLEPGESREQNVAMRVVQLKDPKRLREKGTATQTISYREQCRIRIDDATYDALRLDVEFIAKLRLAQVHRTASLYVVRGLGVVAERADKNVQILGLFPNRTERLRTLAIDAAPAKP